MNFAEMEGMLPGLFEGEGGGLGDMCDCLGGGWGTCVICVLFLSQQ